MSDLIMIPPNHPFFLVDKRVEQFTKPLFKYTSFKYFDYERYYFDGYVTGTHQIQGFGYDALKNGLLPSIEILQSNQSHYIPLSSSIISPAELLDNNQLSKNINLAKQYEVFHRFCLVFNTERYVELFVFGITKEIKSFIETCMSEIKFLEKFCVYFREAAHQIIKDIHQHRVRFDTPETLLYFKEIHFAENAKYQSFINDLKLKKYVVQGNKGACQISAREFECLAWVYKNKTSKEISKILCLSHRTVESYLNNLKLKLGCSSKFELSDIAESHPLIKLYEK